MCSESNFERSGCLDYEAHGTADISFVAAPTDDTLQSWIAQSNQKRGPRDGLNQSKLAIVDEFEA